MFGFLRRKQAAVQRIADAPEGVPVHVRGAVHAPHSLVAPLTKRPCAYWRLEYRTWEFNNGHESIAAQSVDFMLDDGSGYASVLAERATFEIVADIIELGRASELKPETCELLRAHGWTIPAVARVEVCEAVIEPAATFDLRGSATREPLPLIGATIERGYRDGQTTALVFSSGHTVFEPPRERRYLGARR